MNVSADRVNLEHVFSVTRTMLPLLRVAAEAPCIVTVSSIEHFRGIPGFAVYGAFKTAITGFTKSLALELGSEGIRVNAVAPETADSAQVPLDRMIHPSQRHHVPRWIPLGRSGTRRGHRGVCAVSGQPAGGMGYGDGHADGGSIAAAGWYRDDQGKWTNMPVTKGNSTRPAD